MVKFEDKEFVPFHVEEFKSNLKSVLVKLEEEFLWRMHTYFGLNEAPKPAEIKFRGYPGASFVLPDGHIELGFSPDDFDYFNCMNNLDECAFSCAHESGHYLHYLANPGHFTFKTPYCKIKTPVERDAYLEKETIAELSTLAFFEFSQREFPKSIIKHNHNPLPEAIYSIYRKKGIDYCLRTINSLVNQKYTYEDYQIMREIGIKAWNPRRPVIK
ncbi:MAG: hypothetical protein AABX48_01305 [Nanoarchaeota archaeon]